MSNISWNDYKRWLGSVATSDSVPDGPAPAISAWASDTRTISSGQWFVPISGENFDGHKFIAEAVAKGASGFFYDAARKSELPAAILARGIAVTESLAAFQKITSGWRKSLKNLKLVALTGSVGKTTTKEMLGGVLKAAGPTFATQASFNNEVGVPKTLQQLSPEHRFAAVEFGARMPGNIKFLCELGAPDVAGLINVGVAHLGVFGSIENLLNTKLEIFRDSPSHAVCVAYHDDPRILSAAKATGKKVVSFGESPSADVRLLGSTWLSGGDMEVRLGLGTKESKIRLGVAHQAFPINAAAAAAMALAAGAPEHAVMEGLQGFSGIKGRYQVHKLSKLVVVDDTYNANPDSMAAGLATLARAFPSEKKVLVLGDMLELGPESPAEHRKVGALASALSPSLLVAIGKESQEIAAGAAALGKDRVRCFANIDELLAAKLDFAALGGLLYAKASNGVKLSRLVDTVLKENK